MGHLKVSSCVLGFEKLEVFYRCKKWIKAFHISDNDGNEDTNQEIKPDSWFSTYLTKANYYTLEVYSKDLNLIKKQIETLKKMIF